MLMLRLGKTTHDQQVTMVQPNRRRRISLAATTHPEVHGGSDAHTYNHIRITPIFKKGFAIAMPRDRRSPTGALVEFHS